MWMVTFIGAAVMIHKILTSKCSTLPYLIIHVGTIVDKCYEQHLAKVAG